MSNSKLITSLVFLSIFSLVLSTKDCSIGPCFPSAKEVASIFVVNASSTCGIDGPETYCQPTQQVCTDVCDANDNSTRHPPSYVNDVFDLKTFWKSENVVRPVYLQIDFGSIFMLYRSIVTFHFELPAAMYFAKSTDYGATYKAINYHATDCNSFFNMPTTVANRRNGLAVECFLIDKENTPSKQLEYGPTRDSVTAQGMLKSQQNQSFFLMTNLRLMLVSYITPERFNPATATLALNRSLSFTIQDWDVLAACYCNGQASKCEDNTHCVCERNTAGRNCERCLPLYNNRSYEIWQSCQDCGCNNHALSCHYSAAKGYGVCDNCTGNTTGDKCEQCKVENYRNSAVMMNHSNTCIPCGCNLNGVPNILNRTHCHPTTGQCQCKSRVQERACDTCKPTFWNLKESNALGCEECACSAIGTVNATQLCDAANNGQCPCKANVDGRTCDKCKEGYYNLTVSNPQGCVACGCSPAGSVNVSCNSTGGCYCRPKFYGLKCENLESGHFVPSVDSLTVQAEYGSISPAQEVKVHHSMLTLANGKKDLFVGVILKESDNAANPTLLTMTVTIPKTAPYTLALRYVTSSNWHLLKLTVELRTLFSPFSCNGEPTVTRNDPRVFLGNATSNNEAVSFGRNVCLRKGTYTAVLELQTGSSGSEKNATITVDSLVILPTITSYSLFSFGSAAVQQNTTYYYRLASSFKHWSMQSAYGCQALSGYYGYLYGEGKACSCNATGANNPLVCDQCGGQCACKPNVIGRTCERCRPDYYNYTSGSGCQACSCHAMGSNRSSCHATTGQCECKDNVVNRQCSSCRENYYNINSGNGCSDCNCMANYSTSLQCHADTGVCPCKHGIGGIKCTTCKDTFYNLTTSGCTECNCNAIGSFNTTCEKTTGQCPCKDRTVGKTCDKCPFGFFGLGSPHPDGCLECYCSNKTNICKGADGWVEAEEKTELLATVDNTNLDGWLVVNKDGQTVNGVWDWSKVFSLTSSRSLAMGYIKTQVKGEQYFSAPKKYLGQGRFAYTYSMSFRLQQDDDNTPFNSTKGDVILKGKGFNQPIVYRLPSHPGKLFTAYTVKFIEADWHVGTTQGRRPTSTEMLTVLSTLEHIYIRAKWSTVNDQYTRIGNIKMKYSKKSSSGTKAFNVEICNCSKEYEGERCERCAPGYTRLTPNGGLSVKCVPCACNGHSNTCNAESGVCSECQHNTTGNHCEKCANGLYGAATNGTRDDCKPCPCPGGPFSTNQFSPTCSLGNDGKPTCDSCSEGYEGRRCERCKTGYYGTPTNPNGTCLKCNCNGNVDTKIAGNCNTTTGECSNCGYNTTGNSCQQCAPHYYGNALNRTCSSCQCNSKGTRAQEPCNHKTGRCTCLPRVVGMTCDSCEANAFNFSSGEGCTQCNCHPNGASKSQCNETTGICDCKANVLGSKCDSCVSGFYGVHLSTPCQECNCSSNYTLNSSVCDVISGLCQCKVSLGGAKYGGRQCDRCEDRSVGEPENCRPCTDGGKCFDKWYDLITVESNKVRGLEKNVTDMLAAFGGSSVTVDGINTTIQELNKNLTYADGVFNGAQYNTKAKQEQINRIKASINDLHLRLNESSRIIKDAEQYLQTTVNGFNGTVRVLKADRSGPLVDVNGAFVYADWVSLTAMATVYRNRSLKLNESANASFKNITATFETIKLANETAALAARQISDALKKLNQVSSDRADVERILGPTFQAQLQNNSALLDEIRKYSEETKALLQSAITLGNKAESTIKESETIIKNANTTVHQRKLEAEQALANAQNALSGANKSRNDAIHAQTVAAQFKANASAVLKDSQTTLQNVTDGINTISKAINQSREAQVIADRVAGMSMPVSFDTIKGLTNEIKGISVDAALINKTYDGAADGLQKAKDVEALSKKAIDVAQQTLKEVQSIEKAIADAKNLRNETTQIQKQTDAKVNQINNITQSIQSRFGNASLIGRETLQFINKTISTVDKSLQCFNESKKTAEAAVVRAEKANNMTLEAEKLNATVNANITRLSQSIDGLAAIAQANYTSIVNAYNDSVQLYKDVNQAEVLLDKYIEQRKEMETLKKESESLESELDDLIRDFDEETKKYSKCGST